MSAVRTALRLATVAALRDRTWAGRVEDSANTPIDQTIINQPAPYVSVWTDDDDSEGLGTEPDGAGRSILLVIEFGVSAPLQATEGGSKVPVPTASDEGFELIIDGLEMQIKRALVTDAMSLWGRVWKSLVMGIVSINSKRGASAEKSVRWAARQLIYRVKVIADPPAGLVLSPTHPLKKALAAFQAAPENMDMADKVEFFEAMFATDALPDWRIAQGWLGTTGKVVRKMGIAPIFNAEGESPKIAVEEGSIDPQRRPMADVGESDDWFGDAD